jgi:hypothetical protein
VRHGACGWSLETCRGCAGPPGPDLAKRDLNPRTPARVMTISVKAFVIACTSFLRAVSFESYSVVSLFANTRKEIDVMSIRDILRKCVWAVYTQRSEIFPRRPWRSILLYHRTQQISAARSGGPHDTWCSFAASLQSMPEGVTLYHLPEAATSRCVQAAVAARAVFRVFRVFFPHLVRVFVAQSAHALRMGCLDRPGSCCTAGSPAVSISTRYLRSKGSGTIDPPADHRIAHARLRRLF